MKILPFLFLISSATLAYSSNKHEDKKNSTQNTDSVSSSYSDPSAPTPYPSPTSSFNDGDSPIAKASRLQDNEKKECCCNDK